MYERIFFAGNRTVTGTGTIVNGTRIELDRFCCLKILDYKFKKKL